MQFVPSQLGVGLVEGYDKLGAIRSLTKPILRKQVIHLKVQNGLHLRVRSVAFSAT
jgi:hypothetical protein